MATNPKQGAGIEIKPFVNEADAAKAMDRVTRLAEEANKAAEKGNIKRFASLSQRLSAQLDKPHELKIQTKVVFDNTTQSFKQIKTLGAGAMDPLLKASKQADKIQGQGIKKLRKLIELERQKSDAIQASLNSQKLSTQEIEKQTAELQKSLSLQKQLAEAKPVVTTKTSMQGQLREAAQLRDGINRIEVSVNKYGKRVYSLNPAWVAQNKKVQALQRSIKIAEFQTASFGGKVVMAGQAMQAAFGWITAATATLAALGGAVSMLTNRAKDVQALKLTFDGLGQSVEAQNAILGSSRNVALSYGVSLKKVEGAFRRLGPAILESGGSLKDTEGAIKSIAARTTMLGLNTEQSGRYIEAFAQVMGKGKLQSEELNQQFSELDGGLRGQLKNWLAANKGITDFEGAMKRGEITSGLFLEAFDAINVEIRNKFLRSIKDTQKGIETLGQEGGMTLNQLNAKLQTLTTIGLESVGQSLAPIGKELMKVYAAFVQMFTKIATETPGIQKLLQFAGHVLGVIIKVALNTVLMGFTAIVKVVDLWYQGLFGAYEILKRMPVVGNILRGMEGVAKGLNANFDGMTDSVAALSDETVGANAALEKYEKTEKNLLAMKQAGFITEKEYLEAIAELEEKKAAEKKKHLEKQLKAEKENMDELLKRAKTQLKEDKIAMDRKIDVIEKTRDAEIEAIDSSIEKLEEQKDVTSEMYEKKIEDSQRAHEKAKAAIDAEKAALEEQKEQISASFDARIEAVKEFYAQKKAAMDASHSAEMSQIEEKINAMKEEHASAKAAADLEAQNTANRAKIDALQKQIRTAGTAARRAELKAQIDQIRMKEQEARIDQQRAAEVAELEKEKAEIAKRQAEEKKRLEEEEAQRVKELENFRTEALGRIAAAVEKMAGIQKQANEDAKKDQKELKDAKKEAHDSVMKQLEAEKKKRKEITKDAKIDIDLLKGAYEEQRMKVQEIENQTKLVGQAQADLGVQADIVTNGALERQLQKIKDIKKELKGAPPAVANAVQNGALDEPRFSGGPVSGGTRYTVNELGKEGFLSSSGKLSEINAPAFGSWRAPSTGTVIPAHVWKNVKANQNVGPSMPRNVNPGNATARAISTINNSGGNQIQNTVTVQAANPVQAANQLMVEMTRLRRRGLR